MRLSYTSFGELRHFGEKFLVFFVEVLGFANIFVASKEGCEFREAGVGVGTVGGAVGTALEVGNPEVFGVEGCFELFVGDFEGAGSSDFDEVD